MSTYIKLGLAVWTTVDFHMRDVSEILIHYGGTILIQCSPQLGNSRRNSFTAGSYQCFTQYTKCRVPTAEMWRKEAIWQRIWKTIDIVITYNYEIQWNKICLSFIIIYTKQDGCTVFLEIKRRALFLWALVWVVSAMMVSLELQPFLPVASQMCKATWGRVGGTETVSYITGQTEDPLLSHYSSSLAPGLCQPHAEQL